MADAKDKGENNIQISQMLEEEQDSSISDNNTADSADYFTILTTHLWSREQSQVLFQFEILVLITQPVDMPKKTIIAFAILAMFDIGLRF